MKVGREIVQYKKYIKETENKKEAVSEEKIEEKTEEKAQKTDILELSKKEEETEESSLNEYLEKLKELKNTTNKSEKQQKKSLESNAGSIRAKLLAAKSPVLARMALADAYREKASVSMCKGIDGYDAKEIQAAINRLNKIIKAGNMKVKNLVKEEQMEQKIQRVQKNHQLEEARKMRSELWEKQKKNRRNEKKESGDSEASIKRDISFGAQTQSSPSQAASNTNITVNTDMINSDVTSITIESANAIDV